MLGYLTVFVVGSIAFSLIIQGFYKPSPLFPNASLRRRAPGRRAWASSKGLLILGAITIILSLDVRRLAAGASSDNELKFLRDFWNALTTSGTYTLFHDTLIPLFFVLFGWAVPVDIRSIYPAF